MIYNWKTRKLYKNPNKYYLSLIKNFVLLMLGKRKVEMKMFDSG